MCSHLGRLSLSEQGLYAKKRVSFSKKINDSLIFLIGTHLNRFRVKNSLILYQGSFDLDIYKQFFIILPVSIFVEKVSFYYNLEGRLRRTTKAVSVPRIIVSDGEVFKALFFFKNWYIFSNFSLLGGSYTFSFFFIEILSYVCFFSISLLNLIWNVKALIKKYF